MKYKNIERSEPVLGVTCAAISGNTVRIEELIYAKMSGERKMSAKGKIGNGRVLGRVRHLRIVQRRVAEVYRRIKGNGIKKDVAQLGSEPEEHARADAARKQGSLRSVHLSNMKIVVKIENKNGGLQFTLLTSLSAPIQSMMCVMRCTVGSTSTPPMERSVPKGIFRVFNNFTT